MKYLIIDTSTAEYSIGVSDEEKIIAQKSWKNERGKDNELLLGIDKLLSSVIPDPLSVIPAEAGIQSARGEDPGHPASTGKAGRHRNDRGADLGGIIVYLGPGSYTGLRTGITVANTFAYALNIPIVGVKGEDLSDEKFEIAEMSPQNMEELLQKGTSLISEDKVGEYVAPFYGREANVG